MRIFIPFTKLRCETYLACPGAVLVPLRNHELDYALYWQERWREGESFINVEHDVVPRPSTLQEMWDCPEDYCLLQYAYPWEGSPIDHSPIGCAKFSSNFIAGHQILFLQGQHWHDPQHQIIGASLNKYHLHHPPALHLHVTEDWPLAPRRQYGVTQDGYRETGFFKN